jgi:hypothetical protein
MAVLTRFIKISGFAILILLAASPISAQIEDQFSVYSEKNVTGYLQPLSDTFGSELNDGLFHSARISGTGLHISFEVRAMAVMFGDDDRTFSATTESGFTPEQTVTVPTIIGSSKAMIVNGDGGTSFVFPGGFDLNSFAIAVPQLRVGTLHGTEAMVRYFAFNTDNSELGNISLVGFGLRHSLSQYPGPHFPIDIAAGFFWQRFTLGDNLISANALSIGLQASKRLSGGFVKLEPYAGISADMFSMNLSYESDVSGLPKDIAVDFKTSRCFHTTFGLSLHLFFLNFNGEYNIANQNSFSIGLSIGN